MTLTKILENVAKNGLKGNSKNINRRVILQAEAEIKKLIPAKMKCNPSYNQCTEDIKTAMSNGYIKL